MTHHGLLNGEGTECLGSLIIHRPKLRRRQTQKFSVQDIPEDEITMFSKHQTKIIPFQHV